MQIDSHTALGAIRAGGLGGSLRSRVVGLAESLDGPSWFAALVEAGTARIAGEDASLAGPVLVWRPWHRGARATFQAGAAGTYVILGPTALANAAGHMPETRELRDTADRAVTAAVPLSSERFQAMRAAFLGLRRELGSDGAAAHAVVEAYLRIILVEVFRSGQSEMAGGERASPARRVFAEFGALVEAHFRERWTINDYAQGLGLSRDRLGDICRRVRGMGPKDLVDRRVALEARLQLENSSDSIEQVAALLGFASPAQFNRFFRRTVGQPPGAYREAYLVGVERGVRDPARPYDWP